MKPYSQYGVSMRAMLRYMYYAHPKPVRMTYETSGVYEALERDGWVNPIGKRSVILTDRAVHKLRDLNFIKQAEGKYE